MAEAPVDRRSPLHGVSLPSRVGLVSVHAAEPAVRFVYRGAATTLGDAFGMALPVRPMQAATAGDRAALWLGPDEWLLLVSGPRAAADLVAPLVGHLHGKPAALVDVSHRNTALIVDGRRATDLLNAGCPLDLDPEAFAVGMCARTLFAKAEIVLWRQAPERFRVEVWRSYAPYVAGLLAEAARPLGVR